MNTYQTSEERKLEDSIRLLEGTRLVGGRFELRRGTFWPDRDEGYVPPVLGGTP